MAQTQRDPMADILSTPTEQPQKQTLQQIGQQWDKNNPAPQKQEVEAPTLSNNYSYETLLKQYEPQKDSEQEAKREKSRRIIAGIGDAVNSIAGMVGAYKSGIYHAPKQTLSDVYNERAEKIRKAQEEDRKNYLAMYKHAADKEMDENMKKLNMYYQNKRAAESDYNAKVAQHARDRQNYISNADKQNDNDRLEANNAATQAETKRYHDITAAQGQQRLAQGAQRLALEKERQNRENKGNPETIGGLKRKHATGDVEKRTIVAEMAKAGLFTKKDSKGNVVKLTDDQIALQLSQHLTDIGVLLNKGAQSAKGKEILRQHGYE